MLGVHGRNHPRPGLRRISVFLGNLQPIVSYKLHAAGVESEPFHPHFSLSKCLFVLRFPYPWKSVYLRAIIFPWKSEGGKSLPRNRETSRCNIFGSSDSSTWSEYIVEAHPIEFSFFSERSASFSFFIVPDDDEDEKKDGRNLGRAELDEWGLGKGTSYRSQRQCTITQTLRGAKCPKNCDKWFRYI